jgi:hypothetical protein
MIVTLLRRAKVAVGVERARYRVMHEYDLRERSAD